jgi:hypothetical protein
VYIADLGVRIAETGAYAYRDLTGVCGPAQLADTNPPSLLNPGVVASLATPLTRGAEDRAPASPASGRGRRPAADS